MKNDISSSEFRKKDIVAVMAVRDWEKSMCCVILEGIYLKRIKNCEKSQTLQR